MSDRRFTLRHSLHIVLAMGWADFTLKYRGSVLGYLWSLIAPLVKFFVILYVFGPYVSPAIPRYPLYLFLGLIIWDHFVLTTNACMTTLRGKAGLLQKVVFPRLLLIFAVGWAHTIIFGTYLLVFFCFAFPLGLHFGWSALYMPIIVLQMTLLSLGIGMILSSYSLLYQDVQHLWEVAVQILFWLTPIAYSSGVQSAVVRNALHALTHVGGAVQAFTLIQPLSVILFDARRVLLYPASGVPSLSHIAVFTLLYAAIFALGARIFVRRSRYFIQEL